MQMVFSTPLEARLRVGKLRLFEVCAVDYRSHETVKCDVLRLPSKTAETGQVWLPSLVELLRNGISKSVRFDRQVG